MTKSELFKFAHQITKSKNIAFFGSYRAAFASVLKSLYAKGYRKAVKLSGLETDGRIAA
ncbi:MAG: hypothetical protein JWN75_1185 [Candidatus Saccharibacteria bacterium]|nr:hypothetical protein [Candidatus Saccharibacteria bacterium]